MIINSSQKVGGFLQRIILKNKKLKLLDEDKVLFTYLYNSNYSEKNKKYDQIGLLKSDMVMDKCLEKVYNKILTLIKQ